KARRIRRLERGTGRAAERQPIHRLPAQIELGICRGAELRSEIFVPNRQRGLQGFCDRNKYFSEHAVTLSLGIVRWDGAEEGERSRLSESGRHARRRTGRRFERRFWGHILHILGPHVSGADGPSDVLARPQRERGRPIYAQVDCGEATFVTEIVSE